MFPQPIFAPTIAMISRYDHHCLAEYLQKSRTLPINIFQTDALPITAVRAPVDSLERLTRIIGALPGSALKIIGDMSLANVEEQEYGALPHGGELFFYPGQLTWEGICLSRIIKRVKTPSEERACGSVRVEPTDSPGPQCRVSNIPESLNDIGSRQNNTVFTAPRKSRSGELENFAELWIEKRFLGSSDARSEADEHSGVRTIGKMGRSHSPVYFA